MRPRIAAAEARAEQVNREADTPIAAAEAHAKQVICEGAQVNSKPYLENAELQWTEAPANDADCLEVPFLERTTAALPVTEVELEDHLPGHVQQQRLVGILRTLALPKELGQLVPAGWAMPWLEVQQMDLLESYPGLMPLMFASAGTPPSGLPSILDNAGQAGTMSVPAAGPQLAGRADHARQAPRRIREGLWVRQPLRGFVQSRELVDRGTCNAA